MVSFFEEFKVAFRAEDITVLKRLGIYSAYP